MAGHPADSREGFIPGRALANMTDRRMRRVLPATPGLISWGGHVFGFS
jgi:hypothetical protein